VRGALDRRTVLFELGDGRVFGFPRPTSDRLRNASHAERTGVEVAAGCAGMIRKNLAAVG
jgi:hypothetical protein